AASLQHAALAPREELREVVLGYLVEVEPGLGGELRDVPEDVAELPRQGGAALVGQQAAVVADRLRHLFGTLAALAAQAERGVGQVVARIGVHGRGPRAELIVR